MNNLNSLLIEGTTMGGLKGEPPICRFAIATNRFSKGTNGTLEKEVSHFNICVCDNLAKVVQERYRAERGVRIVGRLRQALGGVAEVVAEHVEFMPEFKKESPVKKSSTRKGGQGKMRKEDA